MSQIITKDDIERETCARKLGQILNTNEPEIDAETSSLSSTVDVCLITSHHPLEITSSVGTHTHGPPSGRFGKQVGSQSIKDKF